MNPHPIPQPPKAVTGLPPEQQAAILLEEYTEVVAWGASEANMRQVLIDYIRRVREWYEQL